MKTRDIVPSALLTLLAVSLAPRGAAAQTPVQFSVVGGMSLPAGDLAGGADLGFNLGVRAEGRPLSPGWALRGDLSWDRYDGRGGVDGYSYLALAGNLVHHETGGRLYEFGGLGIYNSRTSYTNTFGTSDTNLGVQLGLGFALTRQAPNVFTEFGLTSAFTSGRSSVWFPVRLGLRF